MAKLVCLLALLGLLLADIAIGKEFTHCDVGAGRTATAAQVGDYRQLAAGSTAKMENGSAPIGAATAVVYCSAELLPTASAVPFVEKAASGYPSPVFTSWYRRTTPIEGRPPRM